MSLLKAIIVDDERPARRRLRTLIERAEEIRIADEASCLREAREALLREHPDILFLDIQLAGETAFDLLPYIPPGTGVVFVTAHPDFAVQAFDQGVVDYLLKPVQFERLCRTIEKCRVQLAAEKQTVSGPGLILIGDRSNWRRVPANHITAIRAEGTYTRVFLRDFTNTLMLRPLKEWEELLRRSSLIRLDRSLLVNTDSILEMRIENRDRGEIDVNGCGEPIEIGRVAIRRMRKHLDGGKSCDRFTQK